jgi:hypothetical protein
VLLKRGLKALHLPTILAECEQVVQRCATDNADHLAFLLHLTESELLDPDARSEAADGFNYAARLLAALFANLFSLDCFFSPPATRAPTGVPDLSSQPSSQDGPFGFGR